MDTESADSCHYQPAIACVKRIPGVLLVRSPHHRRCQRFDMLFEAAGVNGGPPEITSLILGLAMLFVS